MGRELKAMRQNEQKGNKVRRRGKKIRWEDLEEVKQERKNLKWNLKGRGRGGNEERK